MKENPPEEQFLEKWNDLFANPGASLDLLREKGPLSESACPATLIMALWLDFFLVSGEEAVKAKWAVLPPEEQFGLGVELLKCYLTRPLYIRLSENKNLPVIKAPLKMKSQGKFFLVEHGTGPDRQLEWLYPLDHQRFWPALFGVLPENFFTSEKIRKAIEPEMILVSSSGLEKTRRRSDDLIALFSHGNEIPEAPPPGERSEWPPFREDTPEPVSEDVLLVENLEPEKPTPVVADPSPSPVSAPKRKKKKKTSMEQMDLF